MAIQVVNNSVTIATTTTVVSAAREQRQALIISNDSDEVIYLAINAAAVLNKGIRLAVGAVFSLEREDMMNMAINAISTSGSKNICITEIYLDAV